MDITVKKFVAGPLETNAYVVHKPDGSALVFDPSSGCDEIIGYIKKNGLAPRAIVLTHGHFDHIMGIPELQDKWPELVVWVHPEENILLRDTQYNGASMIGEVFTYDGPIHALTEQTTSIEGFEVTVYHVPGHSPGGCAVLIGKNCIVGDCLFAGSIGRADLPGGNASLLMKSIKEKLLMLPDDTVICPGHFGRTSIGREKKSNPFLV